MQKYTVFFITFLCFSSLSKATIWVGGDSSCDYSSIQPAIDALVSGADDQLYIANNNAGNGVYMENLTLVNNRPEQIRIKGGFDQCEGDFTTTNTVVNGGGAAPVLNISGDDTLSNISISDLSLTNGSDDGGLLAGGLIIDDDQLAIALYGVSISNNQGFFGGGVFSRGGTGLSLRLYNTLIFNNTAEYGGGMYCLNPQRITIWDRSGVVYNSASSIEDFAGNGGGLYMDGGCSVTMSSGNLGFNNLEGIIGNSATGNGGGTYVADGSRLILRQTFGSGKYVVYSDNIADADNDGIGDGGAIFLNGSNSILLTGGFSKDVIIKNNTAVDGGAIAAVNNSSVFINPTDSCGEPNPCIEFSGNTAGQNTNGTGEGRGGTFFVDDASVFVQRAKIIESQADTGIIAFVDDGTLDLDFNLIHDNGTTPNAQYNQDYLLVAFNSQVELNHLTLTDNQQDPSTTMLLGINNTRLDINNSILQGIGYQTFEGFTNAGTSLDLRFKCNVMHEDASIGTAGDISDNTVTTSPGFIDGLNRDFRLSAGSIAIDKCNQVNTTAFTQLDYTGQVTGIDDPNIINQLGTYDAGAHENYLWDVIFEDDFE